MEMEYEGVKNALATLFEKEGAYCMKLMKGE
jgi:hypothetical protein